MKGLRPYVYTELTKIKLWLKINKHQTDYD